MTAVRSVLGVLLVAVAVLVAVWAGSVVLIPFRDSYRDSPDATYFVVGGLGFAFAAIFVWGALHTLAPLRRSALRRTRGTRK